MKASALIFDLDGTLVDSVYEHVAAWHRAFYELGITIPACEVHKRIGMTGSLMISALDDVFSLGLDEEKRVRLKSAHSRIYRENIDRTQPLPGAVDLWRILAERKIPWGIATSAEPQDAKVLLDKLHLPDDAVIVTQEDAKESKPAPEPFEAAAKKLRTRIEDSLIVGDAVWDVLASRRAGAFGIGVLTGGYGREELTAAGAYRVYNDVGEMGRRLGELGLGS